MRGEDMNPRAFILIFGRCKAMSVHCQAAEVFQGPDPIVPPRDCLQHQPAHGRICGCKAGGEQRNQRLRTFDQGTDSFVTVGRIRIGSHRGELFFHLVVDLLARLLEQRLIKIAIAYFPGQVTDRGKLPVAHGDHPVQEPAE